VNWIETFLKNRQQFVESRSPDKCVRSRVLAVSNGVPQGSVLGPLLFSIHNNDLTRFLQGMAEYMMYADDCAIVVSAHSDSV